MGSILCVSSHNAKLESVFLTLLLDLMCPLSLKSHQEQFRRALLLQIKGKSDSKSWVSQVNQQLQHVTVTWGRLLPASCFLSHAYVMLTSPVLSLIYWDKPFSTVTILLNDPVMPTTWMEVCICYCTRNMRKYKWSRRDIRQKNAIQIF